MWFIYYNPPDNMSNSSYSVGPIEIQNCLKYEFEIFDITREYDDDDILTILNNMNRTITYKCTTCDENS